jgi:hypothetical protein
LGRQYRLKIIEAPTAKVKLRALHLGAYAAQD